VDQALAELDAWEQEQTAALLEAGVEQDILRRDAFAFARRIEALAALDATDGPPAWSSQYDAYLQRFHAGGDERGLNVFLEIATEMARRMLAAAGNADQRGAALNRLGNALYTRWASARAARRAWKRRSTPIAPR
jgi:hypothetical protein